jgi:Flp pilus assembly pilin Flp
MHTLKTLLRSEAGQDLVEYSLLIVFVLIASAIFLHNTGTSITPVWAAGNSIMQNAAALTS